MKFPMIADSDPAPLPMSLEQFLDFCEFSLQFSKPEHIRQQKNREEQITTRFRLLPAEASQLRQQSTNHEAPILREEE